MGVGVGVVVGGGGGGGGRGVWLRLGTLCTLFCGRLLFLAFEGFI